MHFPMSALCTLAGRPNLMNLLQPITLQAFFGRFLICAFFTDCCSKQRVTEVRLGNVIVYAMFACAHVRRSVVFTFPFLSYTCLYFHS